MANNKAARSQARRITIFNHKGGVGKTTLTVNISIALASLGKRVLLVDADPQCNLTSHLIENDVVDDLLDHSDDPNGQTVWSALRPIVEGSGNVKELKPIELTFPNLYLLPGDIRLSEFEEELNGFWSQCLQRKMRGFIGTTALSALVNSTADKYKIDYVFYDAGPNIGPLNRTVLLDSDYLIIAVATDLFSIRALKTLGRTLAGWIREWSTISSLAPSGTYLLPGMPHLLGYIPQRIRVYGGHPAKQHSRYLSSLHRRIQSEIIAVLQKEQKALVSNKSGLSLGEIKDYGTLVSSAQEKGMPLSEIGSPEQRKVASIQFRDLAKKLIKQAV